MPFKVIISSRSKEEEAKSHNNAIRLVGNTNTTLTYSDASSSEEATGIGVGLVSYDYSQRQRRTIDYTTRNLGKERIVYDGELEGATLGIEYAAKIAKRDWQYIIYSDNQAGLYRLRTPSDNPGQSCQIRAI